MKTLCSATFAIALLLTTAALLAQSGNMMSGGTLGVGGMGEYGGVWMPILLAIVVVGLVAWVLKRGGK